MLWDVSPGEGPRKRERKVLRARANGLQTHDVPSFILCLLTGAWFEPDYRLSNPYILSHSYPVRARRLVWEQAHCLWWKAAEIEIK